MRTLPCAPVSGNYHAEKDCATDFVTKSSENAQYWLTSPYANSRQNPCGFDCSHATFRNAVSVSNCHVSYGSHAIVSNRATQGDSSGVCRGLYDVRDQASSHHASVVQKRQEPK